MAGAAFGSCLKGWEVVARAARGSRNRGRRSTLEMPLPKSWQAQHSVHLSVCLRGRGSIWQLSKGLGCCRARGWGLAKSWQAQHFGDAFAEVVAGAAFGSCLKGWDVVARGAGGSRNRGRRSTLEMPLPKSWQAQHSVHLSVCLRGRGSIWQLSKGLGCCRGSRNRGRRSTLEMPLPKSWQAQYSAHLSVCLRGRGSIWQLSKGWDVVARGAGGSRNRGRRSTLEMPLPKSWQAQHSVHLSVCLRGRGSIWQLSKGLGCCRARGSGRAKLGQAQHFGDAIAEVVAGAAFCASVCVCLRGRGSIWQLSKGLGCCRARGSGRGARNRGRRSTLKIPLPKSWQVRYFVRGRGRGSILCIWARVCVAGQHLATAVQAAVPEQFGSVWLRLQPCQNTSSSRFRTPQSKDSDAWMIWKLLASAVAGATCGAPLLEGVRLEVLSALQRRMHGARLADTCCA